MKNMYTFFSFTQFDSTKPIQILNFWNAKYTIQHRIERSQTSKSIQYNIHDTMSCELANEKNVYKFIGFLLKNYQ